MFDSSHSNNLIANNTINSNDYGIHLDHSSNNTLRGNEISNNSIGIYSIESNSTINSNIVCRNTELDFNSSGWQESSGDDNVCGTGNWNDTGKTGCTLTCKQYLCDFNNSTLKIENYLSLLDL